MFTLKNRRASLSTLLTTSILALGVSPLANALTVSSPSVTGYSITPRCQIHARINASFQTNDQGGADKYFVRIVSGGTNVGQADGFVFPTISNTTAYPKITNITGITNGPLALQWVDAPSSTVISSMNVDLASLHARGGECATAATRAGFVASTNTAPTANAGPNQTLRNVAPGTRVTLDGTSSSDPQNDTLSYLWTQVSGPAVTLSNANAARPSFAYPQQSNVRLKDIAAVLQGPAPINAPGLPAETLVFNLVVSDGSLDSTTDAVSITINTNEAPTANAGNDQTLFGLANGATVTLNGSNSYDPDGDNLTYRWSQTSGPSMTINNSTAVTPTIVFNGSATDNVEETIVLSLIANDGAVDSVADTVSLTFRDNRAPIARAGGDQSPINAGSTVYLNGTGSSDVDGDSISYRWTQVSGPSVTLYNANTARPRFTAPQVSGFTNLVFQLIVNDGKVNSSYDRVRVGVQPTGSITIIQQAAGGDNSFDFTSSLSRLNGSITTQNGSGQMVATRVNTGTYTVTAGDKRADGYALRELSCNDGDSTTNLTGRNATIRLAPGEDVVCVFSSVNSRGAAHKAIREMLVQRSTLLLSNQPNMTRRMDRLQGHAGANGGVRVAGLQLASNGALPLSAQITDRGGKVSGSWAQMQGASAKSGKGSFDVWGEGTIAQFESLGKEGHFSVLYAGADYMLSDKVLVGALVQLDDFESDSQNQIGDVDGKGYMIGPYATARINKNLYIDGRVAWGGSDNTVNPLGDYSDDFETDRFLAAASITGDFQIGDSISIRPTVSIRNLSEKQIEYTDSLGVVIPEQTIDQGEISFSPRLEKKIQMHNGWVARPYGSVEGIVSFGDEVENVFDQTVRARVEGGASFSSPSGVSAGISAFADGLGADNFEAQGIRVSISYVIQNQ